MKEESKKFHGFVTGKELSRVERNRMLGKELMRYRAKTLREQLKKNEKKKKKQKNNQSFLPLVGSGLLFLKIADLPVWFSYFLLLAITLASVYIVKLIWGKNGKKPNPWYLIFSICALLYNPFTSIILFIEKSNPFLGMLIHLTFGLLFILKYSFSLGDKKM